MIMRRIKIQTLGWLLFIVSALFFCFASWRSGDIIALAGSLLFLIACFFFLIPSNSYQKIENYDGKL